MDGPRTAAEGRLRINVPDVMSETIDGEVVAINLVSGNYYSITGAGADVWDLMREAGALSATEIVEILVHQFDAERPEIDSAVTRLLGEMQKDGLIASAESASSQLAPLPANWEARRPFIPPRLEIYTDMQDLVLLDPVHQVEQQGWPHANPEAVRADPAVRSA